MSSFIIFQYAKKSLFMATLQKTFKYEGDPSSSALSTVNLQFRIPAFEFITVLKDGKPFPERNALSEQPINLTKKLSDTSYAIAFPNDILVGHTDNSLKYFYAYLNNIGFTNNNPHLLDSLSVQIDDHIKDDEENLFGQIQHHALYTLSTASDKYKELIDRQAALYIGTAINEEAADKLEEDLINYIRKNIFIINKDLFTEAAIQFRLVEPRFNEYTLLFIIGHVTDVSSGQPKIRIVQDEFRAFLKTHFEIGNAQSIKTLLKNIKNELFDFPITVPEIISVEVKGSFTINTPGNSEVSINDFEFFDLLVEYTIDPEVGNTQAILKKFDWGEIQQPTDNSVPFSFAPLIANFINSSINVRVKAYDGSVVWENQYAVTDPDLQNLKIEVPLLKPVEITAANEPQPIGGNKKLSGKVVELSGMCSLKALTIVVQAKKAGDTIWKIVGSATTDSSGNFSLPYPYGIYEAAQALVSLMPDNPADINVYSDAAHIAINETISDDFLYLLLKDVDCNAENEGEKEEDCDCKDIKKSNRLPDQEELIKSDSYTQDIGGACVNLSIPNRTLSEYAQVAIVRTSDPDVANYILSKDSTGNFMLEGGLTKIVRKPIDLGNPVNWQDAPDDHANLSIYQAVTVATGHILHYKIITKADGYSMGELMYSLPLAPGQKKEIVIFEQTHSLMGSETQRLSQSESLAASLINERGITDTITGNLAESTRGTSSATTAGVSAGHGAAGIIYGIAGTFGIAGGVAKSNSTASQNSSRSLSEYFHEQMKNAINQNAQSYREMNASVITTVQEGQTYGVTSEVVANHNHCHSLTMMYFEVLRHYAIYQELSYVEECLFVPLLMTDFTRENIFKWRDVLASNLLPMPSETYLQPFTLVRSGRQHPLLKAFDAIERIKTNYENVDFPDGAYDDELITFITGEIYIQTSLPRPKSKYDRIKSWPLEKKTTWSWPGALIGGILGGPLGFIVGGYLNSDGSVKTEAHPILDDYISVDANFASVPPAQCIRIKKIDYNFFEEGGFDKAQWTAYARLLGKTTDAQMFDWLSYYFKDRLISEWDSIYYNDIAPLVFEKIYKNISLGNFSAIDFSAETKYKGGNIQMRINLRGNGSNKRRKEITELQVAFANAAGLTNDLVTLTTKNVTIRYSTSHYNGVLFSGYVGDDLVDGSTLYTPENANEKRNPKKEDAYMAKKLIEHLNSNLEHYNKTLWRNLDRDRRYMLLDGFNIETYNDFGQPVGFRSLASVVKNELIGISGNSLIMPVAPGYKIDRTFVVAQPIEGSTEELNLFEHYKPLTPIPPYRISIPSKGVFAEAVQGACDACEKVKDNTSQDWDKFKTDEPTQINPVTVPVPTVTDWKAAFKDFATPIVNIQNAPAAPAPGVGLAGVSDLLGKSDVFKDITGLDQNQKNAMQTYLSNQENAKAFAEMAKEIYMMGQNTENSDKITDSIRNSPELTKEEKAQLLKDHFGQMVDGGQSKKAEQETAQNAKPSLTDAAVKAIDQGKPVKATSTDGSGKAESVDIGGGNEENVLAEVEGPIPNLKQDNINSCWATAATIMMSWKNGRTMTEDEVLTLAGSNYLQKFTDKEQLLSTEKDDFISKLNMVGESPASYPIQKYIDWVKTYGPLWITTDSSEADGYFSPHARILIKITGTSTPDGIGTKFTFIDPATGKIETPQNFNDFLSEYEQMVTDNPGALFIQIVHFKDKITKPIGEGAGIADHWVRLTHPKQFRLNNEAKDAIARLDHYKNTITNQAWVINKNVLFDRLKELVLEPSKVDQGSIGFCGPAAFFRIWIEIEPSAFVDFAGKLFETGQSNIGDMDVSPNSSLLTVDYNLVNGTPNQSIPSAEWMIMSALKDLSVDATGKIQDRDDAETTSRGVADFLEATNLYNPNMTVADEWGGSDRDTVNEVLRKRGNQTDIIMMLDSELIQTMNLSLWPGTNHFVLLTSEFYEDSDEDTFFDYWCWAQERLMQYVNWGQFVWHVGDIIYASRKDAYWYQLPGSATEIAAGPNNSLYTLGAENITGGHPIFKWDGYNWVHVNGAAIKIAVKQDGKPIVVNSDGDIFDWDGNTWNKLPKPISIHPSNPGKAKEIICTADNSIYSLWENDAYPSSGTKIFQWTGTEWIIQGIMGIIFSVEPSGTVWCVDSLDRILRSTGKNEYSAYTWEVIPGKAKSFSIGGDGSVWIVGASSTSGGYGIYKWDGSTWKRVEGGATKIAVNGNGVPYIINSTGKIFQRKPVYPKTKV
jgi:hypothetical protein